MKSTRMLPSATIPFGALGVSLLLILASALPADAGTDSSSSRTARSSPTAAEVQDFALKSQTEQETWTKLTDRDAEEFEASYSRAGLHAQSGLRFSIESATAWRVTPELRMLRIPVAPGQGVEQQTSITAFFDDAGKLIDTTEFMFKATSPASGTVHAWAGGKTVLNQYVSAPGARSSMSLSSKGESISTMDYQRGDWWGNFNQCLSNAGIAAWVITALSIACAAICVVTAGAGCLVCLGAGSAGVSFTVTFCIGMANHYS